MYLFSPTQKKILLAMQQGIQRTLSQLVKDTKLPRSTVYLDVQHLIRGGVVKTIRLSPRKVQYRLASRAELEAVFAKTAEGIESLVLKGASTKPLLVFTDSYVLPEQYLAPLRSKYSIKTYETSPNFLDAELFELRSRGAQVVVSFDGPGIHDTYLTSQPQLEHIVVPTMVYNNVDLGACVRHGVEIHKFNYETQFYAKHTKTEYIVSAILSMLRPIHVANAAVKSGKFSFRDHLGEELYGKKVGIIGIANPSEITAILTMLGCEVFIAKPKRKNSKPDDYGVVKFQTEEDVYDYVDIFIVDTDVEEHYNLEALLKRDSKPKHIIILTPVVKFSADTMRQLILSKKVKGLILDALPNMFETRIFDKDPQQALRQIVNFPNVILTPELSFLTHQSLARSYQYTFDMLYNLKI
ncbi:MAG: NAD(P)-dependent oxidoreductase [Patescibacteria group bacterium]